MGILDRRPDAATRIKHGRIFRRWAALALLWLNAGIVVARAQVGDPPVTEITIGASTEGRPITGVRIGVGPLKLALIGATHGAPEANTYQLVQQLADYFRAHPAEVPAQVSLYVIPLLNPDGLALGSRFNARQVDLNRNLDTSADACPENDWRAVVAGAYGLTSETGGPYPESEVESRIVRDFLLDAHAAIFFHSNAGVVFPACQHPPSTRLAQVFAEGSNYEFIPIWDRYVITGGMHDWAGGMGIAAVTPELLTGDLPEFDQNLRGVQAVLRGGSGLLPPYPEREVAGVPVEPVIWRAWRSWGAERLWGVPIAPARADGRGGWSQLFENGLLEYHPERSAGTSVVQIALLGRDWLGDRVVVPDEPGTGRYFAETRHAIDGPFAQLWEIYGGLPVFGLPLTGEEPGTDEAGQPIVTQTFERTQMMRPAGSSDMASITLRPLGRLRWAQNDARTPVTGVRAR